MGNENSRVWFVTGCSSGFGKELVNILAASGAPTVATVRGKDRVAQLTAEVEENVLVLDLDVTDVRQREAAVECAIERFGRIDILVNNAGYGYQSTVEEGLEAEIRAQFDVNVFALFALTRAVLPIMRRQRSGHIINLSSVAGFVGFAGSGYYAASKHAVEGWSDSLLAEVEPLGIHVTCVEPGPFRTEWAGRSIKQTENAIPDYHLTAGARLQATRRGSGTQPGDPAGAAQLMIALTQQPRPPRHLVLGSWGHGAVMARLQSRIEEIAGQRDVAAFADYKVD